MNRLILSGSISERGALRYTPAGLPALDLQLQHESEITHEGQVRKVSLQVKALVIGPLVSPIAALALGQVAGFAGFLAPARNGRGTLFHITDMLA